MLNLEDYVAPEAEKQIAEMPKEAPKYEMDPSFWQIPSEPPPPYEDDEEPLEIEGPDEGPAADLEDEEEETKANKILDALELPNYDDVEMRLAEPEMTETKQRNYLQKVVKDAEKAKKRAEALKSNATKKFKADKITGEERDKIHNQSKLLQKEIKDYKKHYETKLGTIKGSGQRGRGAYFFNDAKEMLQKLTMIIAEMEAGKLVKKYFPLQYNGKRNSIK